MKRKRIFAVAFPLSVVLCLFMLALNQYLVSWKEEPRKYPVNQRITSYHKTPDQSKEREEKESEDVEENLFEDVDMPFMMNKVINCSRPFVIVRPLGQLGNQLCEASHVIAIKLKYKVPVGVRQDMYDHFKKTFPNFPLPPLPKECMNRTDVHGMSVYDAESYIALHGLDIVISIGGYPCASAFFIQYRSLLRFFYRFYTPVQKSAERYRDSLLHKWRKKMEAAALTDEKIQVPGDKRPVVVGVHVRRSDYLHHMDALHGSKLMEPVFFHDAFAFARKRYGQVAFIVVSDDLPWCHENIVRHHPDAVALDDRISRDEDVALMSLSDHFIFGLGTFGLWGGLLANGEIIYATNVSYDLTRPYKITMWVAESNYDKCIPLLYRKLY